MYKAFDSLGEPHRGFPAYSNYSSSFTDNLIHFCLYEKIYYCIVIDACIRHE